MKAVCDASFYTQVPSVSGIIVMLGSKKSDAVCPLFWKSKSVVKVCKSSKDAETRALEKCVDTSVYLAARIERILFGDFQNRIKSEVWTDSEPLIESIGGTKRVENLTLIPTVEALKENLKEQSVTKFSYVNTKKNPADIGEVDGQIKPFLRDSLM